MQPAIRIELESEITNHRLEKWAEEARTWLGVQVESIEEVQVYKIQPHHTENDGEIISRMHNVFVDPTLQTLHTKDGKYTFDGRQPSFVAEISFRPGVTDNPARSAAEAFSLVGIDADVASGSLYFMFGDIDKKGAEKIAQELFSNTLIQKAEVWAADNFYKMDRFDSIALPKVELSSTPQIMEVSLDLDDTGLEALSKNRCLALTVDELKHIRDYYSKPDIQAARKSKKLPLNPTDVEIEILAQSWSEHCKHKIFSAKIDYQDASGEKQTIDSLYRTYIKGATSEIEKERKLDWLISVFSDNAGIVRFDEKIDLCIKVETHNSPSALDPYGGALTGILGVNRDILGCGMGARPIANTDVFCFAPPDMPKTGEEKYMPDGPKSP
ncbi:MAG: phosphoribosylformylglycinamidine synthase, partial [Alphaproteobacteria bacterium]|nr:phosphoribosylformylglycinamidine synthase [Alphaproteobacteria bacterium]